MGAVAVSVTSRGADLRVVSRRLAEMTDAKAGRLFLRHLRKAASPYPRYVRASVLAIPVTGRKHTGLRAIIAGCVTLSSGVQAREAWVSVWIDPGKMRPAYLTLPLYMEGTGKYIRWRHPVYGNRDNWVTQAPHPYFYQAVATFARAAELALEGALEDVTAELSV